MAIDRRYDRLEDERWYAHYKLHDQLEKDVNRRLDEMASLRHQLDNERGTFITRAGYEMQHNILQAKIETLSRMVWIGFGIVMGVNVLLGMLLRVWAK